MSANQAEGHVFDKIWRTVKLWFPFMGTRTASPRGRYGERPQRDSV